MPTIYPSTKTYEEYLAELGDLTDATGDPVLTEVQLARCLKNARVADPLGYPPDDLRNWTALLEVPPGATLVPTARDGYYYYSALGGTTGETEQEWGPGLTTPLDGDVQWERAGYAPWGGYYDLDRAASEAWRLKASLAAKRKDVDAFGQRNPRTSVYDHCMEQARYYAGRVTDTVTVSSAARRVIY